MTITRATFVDELQAAVPEVGPVVSEHLDDQGGELLLHLLMADLLRYAAAGFHAGDQEVVQRLLAFVDRALIDGDDPVANAVAVSFVEDVGYGGGETRSFIATWPAGLLVERDRQHA
jgi:hypothetical protein